MKELVMKDCLYPQHVPGLGHFKPKTAVVVTDDQIKEYEKATKSKVKDRFDVSTHTPVEEKDTPAKTEKGGES